MKDLVIKRYKIRQKIVKLNNEVTDLKREESIIDDMITYKALQLEEPKEAEIFKKKHIDTRKEGLFKLRVKD